MWLSCIVSETAKYSSKIGNFYTPLVFSNSGGGPCQNFVPVTVWNHQNDGLWLGEDSLMMHGVLKQITNMTHRIDLAYTARGNKTE